MLHRSRFVIAGLLVVVTSAIVSFAVSASMPGALMPAGTTRYAAVYATNEVVVHGDAGWMDVPGMIKYITIPGGQTADVIVIFCGLSGTLTGQGFSTRALIRDVVASPAEFNMSNLTGGTGTSTCAIFTKSNVTSGSPAVKMQWDEQGGVGDIAAVRSRQMLVIVNSH